jgi:hypothetical protein
MTDLDDRTGLCSPVTLSNEKAPSPIRACSHPHPPGSGRLGTAHADARPIADPVPSRPGRHPSATTLRPAPLVHADRKRE